MNFLENPSRFGTGHKANALCVVGGVCLVLSSFWIAGCGMAGAPQPPSLKLPVPAEDLTAVRSGRSVTLHWTMPRKSTDHLLLKGPVPAGICWREGAGGCQSAGQASGDPGAKNDFQAILPMSLQSGEPRPVSFYVELKSPQGRSAGLSNPAAVLAGEAPGPVLGLAAEARADGVALTWTDAEKPEDRNSPIRLHRKLVTQGTPKSSAAAQRSKENPTGLMKPATEALLQDLLVEAPQGAETPGALDKTARFGNVYEYTAQRLYRVTIGGKPMELAGEVSQPIRISVVDTFPPAVPQGLVAVYVQEEKTIDLSWDPDSEEDLAGYIVYRSEAESGQWMRVSPEQAVAGTAYRDSTVEVGHRYRYAVTAIDLTGHESQRSKEARESVPNQ